MVAALNLQQTSVHATMNRDDSHESKKPAVAAVENESNECIEFGYLLLENTPVRLRLPYDEKSCRPNVWYNVQFTAGAPVLQEGACPRCDLVLIQEGKYLSLPWETLGPSVAVSSSSSSSSSSTGPLVTTPAIESSSANVASKKEQQNVEDFSCTCRSRSDGAILFDILKSLQSDIFIMECRALFLDETFQKAAIYVTLNFPWLSQTKTGMRSLLGTRTSKPLSNRWQLILSLLRSDWENLDGIVTSLQDPSVTNGRHAQRIKKASVFPPRLTMEELYRRIQDSPFDHETRQKSLDRKLSEQMGALARLPSDIIENSVAPFLDARALDSLRRTCSYYYGLLERVVPGLKLGLYRHQISSLVWMRERERHELWEADCLDNTPNGRCAPDGDLHRAVTGGHTVRLCRRNGRIEDCFRVDTFTGREFQPTASSGGVIPRRHVCRGGLLVDEPGLGKTITVLSLVLQTAGLSTESSMEKVMQEGSGTDDKSLFDSYWRECVPPSFQHADLNRILNKVAKRGPRGCFPVNLLHERIDSDVYGFDFDLFVKDLE